MMSSFSLSFVQRRLASSKTVGFEANNSITHYHSHSQGGGNSKGDSNGKAEGNVNPRLRHRLFRAATSSTIMRLLAALLLLLSMAWGCDEFSEPSQLDSLRIMAVQAEPPEAAPGETVTLDALTFSPPGSGPINVEWRACLLQDALLFTELLAGTQLAGSENESGDGGDGGGSGDGVASEPPKTCFDMANVLDPSDDSATLEAALDLTDTAILLGTQMQAQLEIPLLPAFPALPSLCTYLSIEERLEQGGREQWIRGMWLTVSLKIQNGSDTEIANKRVVVRPPHDQISDQLQGMPFRTPNLCGEDHSLALSQALAKAQEEEQTQVQKQDEGEQSLCQRNINPEMPTLAAPQWPEGGAPLQVHAGRALQLTPTTPEPGALQPFVAMASCILQESNEQIGAMGGEYARVEGRGWAWYADAGSFDINETYLDSSYANATDDSLENGLEGGQDAAGEEGETAANWDASVASVKWTAPKKITRPAEVTLYMVMRDGRGGISWASFPVEVLP